MDFSQTILNAVDIGDLFVVAVSVLLSIATYWLGRRHANWLFERENYPDIQLRPRLQPESGNLCLNITLNTNNLSSTTSAKNIQIKIDILKRGPVRLFNRRLLTYNEHFIPSLAPGGNVLTPTHVEMKEISCLESILSELTSPLLIRDKRSPFAFTADKKLKLILRFSVEYTPAIHGVTKPLEARKTIMLIPQIDDEGRLLSWDGKPG